MAKPNTVEDLGFQETAPAPEPRRRKPAAVATQAEPAEEKWPAHFGRAVALLHDLREVSEARMRRPEILAHRARIRSLERHCHAMQQTPAAPPIMANERAALATAEQNRRQNVAAELARLKAAK